MIVKFDSLQEAVVFAVHLGLSWQSVKPIMGKDPNKCDGFYIDVPVTDEMIQSEEITSGIIKQSTGEKND